MAITSGFFNGELVDDEYDRFYDSDDIGSMFDGLFSDGIFNHIGNRLEVTPSTGFSVNVGIGKAWFKHTWIINDAIYNIPIGNPDAGRSRIDTVVIDINKEVEVRENSIILIPGAPSSVDPVPATLIDTDDHKQYPLAYITINDGDTEIKTTKIRDNRGTASCPFVGILEGSITAEELLRQLTAQGEEMIAEGQLAFDVLYDELQGMIEELGPQSVIDNSVSTSKVVDGAITRAKLNSDALYSPIVVMSDSQYYISSSDCGKTFRVGQETQFVIDAQTSQDLPSGFEIAIINYGDDTNNVTIFFDGVPVCAAGARYTSSAHPTIRITDGYTMIAIKKITAADTWLVTGSVEVVS